MLIILPIVIITALILLFLLWEHFKKAQPAGPVKDSKPATAEGQTPPASLTQAQEEAQRIITEAQVESLKIAAEAKMGTEAFVGEYDKKLSADAVAAIAEFKNFLSDLQKNTQATETQMETVFKDKVNQMLFNLEQNLSNFMVSSQQKSLESINLELKSARQLIDTYKSEQLSLIDENIVAVLERTLALVMTKKLTLSDQLDLVYEALEKAKLEKFFA